MTKPSLNWPRYLTQTCYSEHHPFFDTYGSDHRIVLEIEPRVVGEESATPVHTREPQMTSDQSYTLGSLEFQDKSGDSLVVSGKISDDL